MSQLSFSLKAHSTQAGLIDCNKIQYNKLWTKKTTGTKWSSCQKYVGPLVAALNSVSQEKAGQQRSK